MKKTSILFVGFLGLFLASNVFAEVPTIRTFPEKVIQGEPVKIVVENASSTAAVRKISFDGKPVGVFMFQGKPTGFVGIDLNKKSGDYKVLVTLANTSILEKTVSVGKRKKVEALLGIPEKLGGSTLSAAKQIVSSLTKENESIYSVRSFPRALWTEDFRFPIPDPKLTDAYGYSRKTVGYTITHKGTDFRASEGTPILAMNRGIVRLARTYRVYGKVIIIDHGLGVHTVYMHLSKINFNEGELVKRGQVIGLSGKTGYAESPHLHLSVWIDKVSVDPMKFMSLF